MSIEYNFVNCDIDFGHVPIGTTNVKTFSVKNNHYESAEFHVTRNNQTNPIYHVFDINKYEVKIGPGSKFRLKFSYAPSIPKNKDFDYFTVSSTKGDCYHLSLRGECIGPCVTSSVRNLTFFKTAKRKLAKHVFVLKNTSTVPAMFQFDSCEEDRCVFGVEPIKGSLPPREEQYVTVRFFPKESTLYSRQLCCLILHHDPIVVNLLGVSSSANELNSDTISFRFYPFPFEETVGFKCYLSDSVNVKKVPPPFSLSVNYLDFGRSQPGSSCQTLTTSLTNHMEYPIRPQWESAGLFKIYPEKLEIPGRQSALFECRFTPDAPERLAAATIAGHVGWVHCAYEDEMTERVLTKLKRRILGHSFPANLAWIPSISVVPQNVILPLSLPNSPSWTTFMIQSLGHLPVLYKLVPPSKSNFIMKPMVGLIRNFQIIAVQLESMSTEPTSYVEKWSIELNGSLERSIFLYIKAQTDIPMIRVGNDNTFHFGHIQPGTQGDLYCPIKNISSCQLEFEFQFLEDFGIEPSQGILSPNEEILIFAWYKTAKDQNGSKEEEVICRIQFVDSESTKIGPLYEMPVLVQATIEYSELCAFPNMYQCGEVEFGALVETSFYLFNFGQSPVNFQLSHDHGTEDVHLNPIISSCGPNHKLMVTVSFNVRNLGKNTLTISYRNRESYLHSELLEEQAGINVFKIEYDCIFPTLQFVDLVQHNFGNLFSNDDLWRMLRIDEINAALVEANSGEIRRIELCVPDFEVSDKRFYLVFTIKNISSICTRLVLKRRQVCNCKVKESDESLSFRIKVSDCPHKDLVSLDISNPTIPSNGMQELRFNIKYVFSSREMVSHIVELSAQRTIILNIFIEGISSEVSLLSVYDDSCVLNMGCVFIGLRDAPVFAFWLYNSTRKSVSFKLDELEIVKLCNEDDFPVLTCLNPGGVVGPQTSRPILFKFWPIEVKRYSVSVPVLLGAKEVTLHIEGHGTDKVNRAEFRKFTQVIPKEIQNKMISLSVDRLYIEPILVSSGTQRMFFINNSSRQKQVQYSWRICSIDGLVKIEPTNACGILGPKESHPVFIKIQSLNEACSIRVLLCCEFVDYDDLMKYTVAVKERRRSSNKEVAISETDLKEVSEEFLLEPEYSYISLPITLHVVGISDRDNCMNSGDQMKQKISDGVDLHTEKIFKDYMEKVKVKERPIQQEIYQEGNKDSTATHPEIVNREIIKSVIEQIASEAVFCDYFQELVKNLPNEPRPFYSQVKLDPRERAKEVERFLTRSKRSEVGKTCGELIIDTIHKNFHLGPVKRDQL